jgi:hypothetical protein
MLSLQVVSRNRVNADAVLKEIDGGRRPLPAMLITARTQPDCEDMAGMKTIAALVALERVASPWLLPSTASLGISPAVVEPLIVERMPSQFAARGSRHD